MKTRVLAMLLVLGMLACLLAAWLSLSMSEIRGLTKSKSIYNDQLYVVETLVRVKRQDVRKEGGKEEERSRALDIPPYIQKLIDRVPGDVLVPLTGKQIYGRFKKAIAAAGKDLPLRVVTITAEGAVLKEETTDAGR